MRCAKQICVQSSANSPLKTATSLLLMLSFTALISALGCSGASQDTKEETAAQKQETPKQASREKTEQPDEEAMTKDRGNPSKPKEVPDKSKIKSVEIPLQSPGGRFAFDRLRGRLAVLEFESSLMTIYDTNNGFKKIASVETPARPISVCYKQWQGQGHFITGGMLDSLIRVCNSNDGTAIGELRASTSVILDLASSSDQNDPYVYYLCDNTHSRYEKRPRRFHIGTLKDEGLSEAGAGTSATDIAISPNGALLYQRNRNSSGNRIQASRISRLTPGEDSLFRLNPLPGSGYARRALKRRAIWEIEQGARWALGQGMSWAFEQDGFYVLEGDQIFDNRAKKSLGMFEFTPITFLGTLPFVAGYKENMLQVASLTSHKTVSSYQLPQDWLQKVPSDQKALDKLGARRFCLERNDISPIFFDQANKRLLLCDRSRVLIIPLGILNLPDEPSPCFQVQLPRVISVGKVIDEPIHLRDPGTKIRLLSGPEGMVIEKNRLKWTTTGKNVGLRDILLQGKNGQAIVELTRTVDVRRETVDLPFPPNRVAISKGGNKLIVLGGLSRKEVHYGGEHTFKELAVVDAKTRKILSHIQLQPPADSAIESNGAVFALTIEGLAGSRSFFVRKYDLNSLKLLRTSETFLNQDQKVPDKKVYGLVHGYNYCIDCDELKKVEDDSPDNRVCINMASRQLVSNRYDLPLGDYFWRGERYDANGTLRLIKQWDLSRYLVCIVPGNPTDSMFWGRSPSSFRKSRLANRSLKNSNPSILVLPHIEQRNATVFSSFAPFLAVTRYAWNNSRELEIRPSILIYELTKGKQVDQLFLCADRHDRHIEKKGLLAISKSWIATCYNGELYLIPTSDISSEKYPKPFRFKPAVKTHVLSTKKETRVEYEFLDGKPPYKIETEFNPPGSSYQSSRKKNKPVFKVEGNAIIFNPEEVRALAAHFFMKKGQQTIKSIEDNLRKSSADFQRVIGRTPVGFPVKFDITLLGKDSQGQEAVLSHSLLVDIPKAELARELQKRSYGTYADAIMKISTKQPLGKKPGNSGAPAKSNADTEKELTLLYCQDFRNKYHSDKPMPKAELETAIKTAQAELSIQIKQRLSQQLSMLLLKRPWTDSQGRKLNARFDRIFGDNAIFRLRSGEDLTVKIKNLSDEDQQVIKRVEAALAGDHSIHLRQILALRVLGDALHRYYRQYNRYPPAALLDEEGKPLFSWRIILLSRLGGEKILELLRYDEPWDSVHNRKVLSEVPEVFLPTQNGQVLIQALETNSSLMQANKMADLKEMKDPAEQVAVLAVCAKSDAVDWASPEQLDLKLLAKSTSSTMALFADGQVRIIPPATPFIEWKKICSPTDGLRLKVKLKDALPFTSD